MIQKKLGKRHYDCIISHNGRVIKRHLNQIRNSFDPNETIPTNTNDQQASNERTVLSESDTFVAHDDSQTNDSDGDGSLYDPDATVYNSLDSTLVSTDESFHDAVSTPRPVRASARTAMERLDTLRRADRI